MTNSHGEYLLFMPRLVLSSSSTMANSPRGRDLRQNPNSPIFVLQYAGKFITPVLNAIPNSYTFTNGRKEFFLLLVFRLVEQTTQNTDVQITNICCIFPPAFGCSALQTLVEMPIFSVFAADIL